MFVFDLQRFAYNANLGYDPEVETGEGSETSSAIKVEYTKDGTKTTKYFNNMQAAMDHIYEECTTPHIGTGRNAIPQNPACQATVTLLKNVTDGVGFTIGQKRKKDALQNEISRAVNIVIDLNDKEYVFKDAIGPDNASGIVESKGVEIFAPEYNYNNTVTGDDALKSSIYIKNGKLSIAEQTEGGTFQRMIKCYIDFTLDDVTVDGSNLRNQGAKADHAIIAQAFGKLTLKGDTSFITRPDIDGNVYYAVSGLHTWRDPSKFDPSEEKEKFDEVAGYNYNDGVEIEVNTSGYDRNGNEAVIKNIGFIGDHWNGYTKTDGGDYFEDLKNKNHKIIIKGNSKVGEINLDANIAKSAADVDSKLASVLKIDSGFKGSFDSFNYTDGAKTPLLVYSKVAGTDTDYAIGTAGWNKDATKSSPDTNYIFVDTIATAATKVAPATGLNVVTMSNVEDESVIKSDGKNLLVPNGATATWNVDGYTDASHGDYKLVKATYSGDTNVTINSADAQATINTNALLGTKVQLINASDVNVAVSIMGNTLSNTIYGGTGNDTLKGSSETAIASMGGANVFVYNGGADVIQDYRVGAYDDRVSLSSDIDAVTDVSKVTSSSGNLVLTFDTNKTLTFTNGATNAVAGREIIVQGDEGTYLYTKDYIAQDDGVTLAPGYSDEKVPLGYSADRNRGFKTIDASYVTGKASFSITGDVNNNYIIASSLGGVLYGATGNDTLKGGSGKDTFRYTAGRDVIEDYRVEGNDVVDVQSSLITAAEYDRNYNLIFTIDKNRKLTFVATGEKNNTPVNRIALSGENAGSLSADGLIQNDNLTLFETAKGRIAVDSDFKGIDATNVKDKTVTLVGGSENGTFTFAKNNKKKDTFEFNNGSATIQNYEAGYDKVELGINPMSGFSVSEDKKDVQISIGSGEKTISVVGGARNELLLHDGTSKGNSFSKIVFFDTGILHNKAKNPTEATISASASRYNADKSIKKVFAVNGIGNINIVSGENKTTLDASEAGAKVTLTGGTKNNKFIGSGYADMFVYKGGKDVVNNFVATGKTDSIDSISLDGDFDIKDAKITVSRKSLKFKFESKNTLTLKGDSEIESLSVGGQNYTLDKNAYSIGEQKSHVSLTSQFGGTYKVDKGVVSYVDGSLVQKNLTFKGTAEQESLIGGQKKTTFKGGGGGDSLVGGSGKDIFFYAKGDTGENKIADFEFGVDKLKIANGTIHSITAAGGKIKFEMTSGKKNDTATVGSFLLENSSGRENVDTTKVLIKANNTYYWFADGDTNTADGVSVGDLITADKKVTRADAIKTGYEILDLGYSTNLAKSGVAVKAGSFSFSTTGIKKA